MNNFLVCLICVLSLFAYSGGQNEQPLPEAIAESFEKELPGQISDSSVPGAAIAIVDDRSIVWEHTFGHVAGDDSRPVDASTIFSIQSMSKSFTALAVLMAVQDGLVDLDRPIKEYLPDFTVNSIYDANPAETISLRHLLSHRAGFTHEAPFGSNYDNRNDFGSHIESISNTWLRYPVGYRLAYSNLGIDLAGYILQVRSGKPFESYVKEKVFEPIGMTGSSVDIDTIENNGNRAIGHSNHRDTLPLRIPMIPAGGVYASASDMAKYLQFHINKGVVDGRRILSADLMEEMHSIQFASPGQRTGYCLGLIREPVADSYNLYHSGGGYGFLTDMVVYPEKNVGVVLLTNSNSAASDISSWRLRDRINKHIFERYGDTPVDEPGTETMTQLEKDDWRVQAVIGRYGGDHGMSIESEGEGELGIRYPSGDLYELKFYDDDGELVGFYGMFSEVRFLPPLNGRRGSLTLVNRRVGNRATFNIHDFNDAPSDPPGPNEPHWSEYVGTYELLSNGEPAHTVRITVRNGYLYAGEDKCIEHLPGFFFTFDGEALDFRPDPPTKRNILLRKVEAQPE